MAKFIEKIVLSLWKIKNMITKIQQKSISNQEGGWEDVKYSECNAVKLPEPEIISPNHELYCRRGYKLFWRDPESKRKTIQFTVSKAEFEASGLRIGDIKMIKVNDGLI